MAREISDEHYVIDICEEILGSACSRQHRFDWLLGDVGQGGRRVRLPVDAYWPELKLVVEYRERQHDEPNRHFDKPDRLTVSGVHRGEQRAMYDRRREQLIPEHGLTLIVIKPTDLACNSRGRLLRNRGEDRRAIAEMLRRG